jgi:hypothetical protein
MLLKYPTGFYTESITKQELNNNSITYLVSNTEPPRTDLVYSKVPLGVLTAVRDPKSQDIITRRKLTFGDLIYSVSKADRSEEGNNSRQYELGQTLEFNAVNGVEAEPMLVSGFTEVQHNTNRIDYENIGLTEEEKSAIEDVSLATQKLLMDRLNEAKRNRLNAEEGINVAQKTINETTKTIQSLEITLMEAPTYSSLSTELVEVEDIIIKLKTRRESAFTQRDDNLVKANFYASEATKLIDRLRTVGVLVK